MDIVMMYVIILNGVVCIRFCCMDDGGDIVCKKCSKFWRWNGFYYLEIIFLWFYWCEDIMF